MATYQPEPFGGGDLNALIEYLQRELRRVGDATNAVILEELAREPEKVREWLVVAADGVHWNPGSGRGLYVWYSGNWHLLG